MSTLNEKPEDASTKQKGQHHEGAPDANTGNALDGNALEEISGGTPGHDARPMDSVADMYDAPHPYKSYGGREGKSGA
nr:hypothetical protein [uncultured Noviherbaspirillum sp.]